MFGFYLSVMVRDLRPSRRNKGDTKMTTSSEEYLFFNERPADDGWPEDAGRWPMFGSAARLSELSEQVDRVDPLSRSLDK